MYARVCCATGWTWDYVGQCMTLPRLYALFKHWDTVAPLDVSASALAFAIGALKKTEPPPAEGTPAHDAAVADFMGKLGISGMKRRELPA